MKKILVVAILLISVGLQAQDKLSKLMFSYIDGKYEKVIKDGDNLAHDQEYRHKSRVYLYTSMAYFALSKKKGIGDEYKHAFRDALKNAAKFVKYDVKYNKSKNLKNNKHFLDLLRDSVFYASKLLASKQNYYEASFMITRIQSALPNDPVVGLLCGAYQMEGHDMSDGIKNVKSALKVIKPGYKPERGEEQALYDAVSSYNEVINDPKFQQYFEMLNYKVSDSDKADVLKMMKEFKALIPKSDADKVKHSDDEHVVYGKFKSQKQEDSK